MKKIGILTFHWADNYGALLQTYALSKWISNNTKNSVEVVNYTCSKEAKKYRLFQVQGISLHSLYRVLKGIYRFPKWYRRKKGFDRFRKNIPISAPLTRSELMEGKGDFDLWITGSDQVWNAEIVNDDLNIYDLSFVQNSAKISYAASSGMLDQSNGAVSGNFLADINQLDAVSVREQSTKQFLQDAIKKEVTHVCDPTFLLSKEEWASQFVHERIHKKPYVFVYVLSNGEITANIVRKIARQYHLDIVVCGNITALKDCSVKYECASPEEFLNLLYYCDYAVVSSFHGTIFSIIFERQFLSIIPDYASNRVLDLCQIAGLGKRAVSGIYIKKIIKKQIDYTKVNNNLKPLIDSSKDFLNHWI